MNIFGKHLLSGFAILSIFILQCFAQADQPVRTSQDERVVIGTNLVTVNVSVVDTRGRHVGGLGQSDFELFDDRASQKIAHFSAEDSPFSLAIVYEVHDLRADRTASTLRSLKRFSRTLRDRDEFFFVAFDKSSSLALDFVPTLEQLAENLKPFQKNKPSSLYDSIIATADRLRKARNAKKAFLLISDGQDDRSRHSFQDVRARLREFDVQIFSVGIADPERDPLAGYGRWVIDDLNGQTGRRTFLSRSDATIGRAVLEELARTSGGSTYAAEEGNELELTAVCTQIAVELRRQYTLAFYPSDAIRRGASHRIRVLVKRGRDSTKVFVTHRQSYQLPLN